MTEAAKKTFVVTYARPHDRGAAVIKWSAVAVGWGEVTFYMEDGRLKCDSEQMSREFVKAVLNKMVDDAQFDWEDEK